VYLAIVVVLIHEHPPPMRQVGEDQRARGQSGSYDAPTISPSDTTISHLKPRTTRGSAGRRRIDVREIRVDDDRGTSRARRMRDPTTVSPEARGKSNASPIAASCESAARWTERA